jgi:hypothetical protein
MDFVPCPSLTPPGYGGRMCGGGPAPTHSRAKHSTASQCVSHSSESADSWQVQHAHHHLFDTLLLLVLTSAAIAADMAGCLAAWLPATLTHQPRNPDTPPPTAAALTPLSPYTPRPFHPLPLRTSHGWARHAPWWPHHRWTCSSSSSSSSSSSNTNTAGNLSTLHSSRTHCQRHCQHRTQQPPAPLLPASHCCNQQYPDLHKGWVGPGGGSL